MESNASTTTRDHLLPSITASWHEAWTIFRGRFWTFVALAIFPQIFTSGAVYLLSSVILGDIKASGSLAQAFSPGNPIVYVLIAATLLLFVLQIFAAVAVIVAATKRGHIGLMQAYDEARHSVWSFFVVGILTTVLALVAVVVGYVVIALLTAILIALHVPDTSAWFNSLTIIPYALSLLVIARYILAGVAVVLEKKSAVEALRRSTELMRGHYWHIVLRVLLVYAVIFAVIFGAGFIPYVGGLLAAALSIPFGVIYTFVLFEELTLTKK